MMVVPGRLRPWEREDYLVQAECALANPQIDRWPDSLGGLRPGRSQGTARMTLCLRQTTASWGSREEVSVIPSREGGSRRTACASSAPRRLTYCLMEAVLSHLDEAMT